ncbi:hypothetical protein VTI28DRAFT_1017 [Corynascus sepedonium]
MGPSPAWHRIRRVMVGESHRRAAKSPRIAACVCWLHRTGGCVAPGITSAIESARRKGAWFLVSCATLADISNELRNRSSTFYDLTANCRIMGCAGCRDMAPYLAFPIARMNGRRGRASGGDACAGTNHLSTGLPSQYEENMRRTRDGDFAPDSYAQSGLPGRVSSERGQRIIQVDCRPTQHQRTQTNSPGESMIRRAAFCRYLVVKADWIMEHLARTRLPHPFT